MEGLRGPSGELTARLSWCCLPPCFCHTAPYVHERARICARARKSDARGAFSTALAWLLAIDGAAACALLYLLQNFAYTVKTAASRLWVYEAYLDRPLIIGGRC